MGFDTRAIIRSRGRTGPRNTPGSLDSAAVSTSSVRSFWRGPWPWVAAAGLLVVGYAAWQWLPSIVSEEPTPLVDERPLGGPADIVALAERDDTNILFVLIDTLRAERLRIYGYHRPTSPFLDVFAAQGVRFGHHLAQSSWTKCSMASLWSGFYPQRAGVTRFDDVVPDGARMPAEILRDAGFRTAGIWRNGWVEGYFGFAQGFDTYGRPGIKPTSDEVRRENPTAEDRGTDEDVVRAAEEFLRIHGRHRWFLYLHLMDVHEYTYDASTAKFGTAMGDIYDNAVLRNNYVLDMLFATLAARGLLDETIFVVSSDHGEAFGERGL
jgi:arylsulfatase